MISPHTPPGTKIVCIDDKINIQYVTPGYPDIRNDLLDGLKEGEIYTVHRIVESPLSSVRFCVILAEIKRKSPNSGFWLGRFRYLNLPKSITDLLASKPSDIIDDVMEKLDPIKENV